MDIFGQLLGQSASDSRIYAPVVGIVTNNQDPDKLGRVKVKLPWLSEKDESDWARVVTPMAGAKRGMYFLPEVDDEVLVAFEHGDVRLPYVLGALWNGKDKPPEDNSDGKNNVRTIKSRSGHIVRLDDTKGEEKIEVIDKSTKNSITINTKDNSITISADADISIKSAKGKLTLQSKDGIAIKSDGDITVESGKDKLAFTKSRIAMVAPTVEVKAKTSMELDGGNTLNAKGGMVNIN
ncbi:MAG: phage baseplate assembly protein V [Gammaproteobacteria bacterium]